MNNTIDVEINGNKVTLTLTDDQISQLQKAAKKEWWEEIEYEMRNLYVENGGVARIGYLLSSNCENNIVVYRPSIFYFCDPTKNNIVFNNEKQAQLAAEYTNLFTEMYNFAQLRNGSSKIDWSNHHIFKYTLELNGASLTLSVTKWSFIVNSIFGLAFLKKEHAQEAIEIFGERIIALFSKLQNY